MEDEKYENDNFEEDNNIDDLLDYNDFESNDIDNNNDLDSFNNDIIKIYEDHKKIPNMKGNEMMNNLRPISSYQRNMNTDKENKNNLNNEENKKSDRFQKDNLSGNEKNPINITINNKTSPPKAINLDVKEILERFNHFIQKNKLKREDFIESEEIFLSKEDFKDLFRKLRFDISKEEVNFLFSYNNQYSGNEFIRMRNFLELYPLEFLEFKTEKLETEKIDMIKINQEFRNLHGEILNIIKNDIIENSGKNEAVFRSKNNIVRNKSALKISNISTRPVSAMPNKIERNILNFNKNKISQIENSDLINKNNKQSNKILNINEDEEVNSKVSDFEKNNTNIVMENSDNNRVLTKLPQREKSFQIFETQKESIDKLNYDESKKEEKDEIIFRDGDLKQKARNFLRNSLIKKKEEDEMLKKKIKKQQLEFEADCKKKILLANYMLKEIGTNKKYTLITDTDGIIRCLVEEFEKNPKENFYKIELKAFMAEFRVINKMFKRDRGRSVTDRPKTATNIKKINTSNGGKLYSANNDNMEGLYENFKNKGLNSNSLTNSEKKDFIKKILITAMKMKIKLKEQLDALLNNETFPESLILNNLNFSN